MQQMMKRVGMIMQVASLKKSDGANSPENMQDYYYGHSTRSYAKNIDRDITRKRQSSFFQQGNSYFKEITYSKFAHQNQCFLSQSSLNSSLLLRNLLILKFEVLTVQSNRIEPQDDRKRKRPLQKLINIVPQSLILIVEQSNRSIIGTDVVLYHVQGEQHKFEVEIVQIDRLDFQTDQAADHCVVDLGYEGQDEEGGGATCVPTVVALACVEVCCTAHQQHCSHHTDDHTHLRLVLIESNHMFLRYRLQIEIVHKPSKYQQSSTGYRRNSKEHELREMSRTVTDPAFGKGRFVPFDLRDVVDDDQSDQYGVGRDLEEDGGRETSREHPKVQGFIIKRPIDLSTK